MLKQKSDNSEHPLASSAATSGIFAIKDSGKKPYSLVLYYMTFIIHKFKN